MVKAYSRYTESGSLGAIHSDAPGNTVAWSVDGKTIFSAVGTSVIQLNAKTGVKTGSISCSPIEKDEGLNSSALSLKQPARTTSIAVTSEYLGMGCTDGSVRIVRLPAVSEEDQVAVFRGHRGSVNAVAFGDTGLLATGGRDTEIVIWDLVGESGVCRLTGHKGEITSLAFVPGTNDDFVVSSSKDGLIKVWSLKLQICVQTLTESKSEVWSLCFVPGTRQLVAGSSDKVLYVYRLGTDLVIRNDGLKVFEFYGQLDRPESGGEGKISSLGVCANVLVAQTDRRVVEIWRIVTDESEKTKRMKRRIKRSDNEQEEYRASDEFVVASSPESPSVALRYIANGKLRSMAVLAEMSGTGSIVLGLNDNQIEVFKLGIGESVFVKESKMIKREGHRSGIVGVSVSADNTRLVTVSNESIIVWNAVTLAFQKVVYSPSGEVVTASFVPNGLNDLIVLVTKDGHVCGIDVNTGSIAGAPIVLWDKVPEDESSDNSKRRRKNIENDEVKCVFLSSKNQLFIGTKSRQIFIVSMTVSDDGSVIQFTIANDVFSIPDEPVCLSLSPKTGTYLAIGLMNSNVELVYADTGKHYMSLYSHKLPVTAVAFTPDEQAVVSGSVDKNLKIWSIKFGNVLKSIRAHDAGISCLRFIPHSHLCWSAGRDGVVSLWDIDRFERVLSKVNHASSEATCIATSRDAGMVFSGGLDRGIKRLTRSEDQMFIEEEMEKAMELEVEGEAQRDDLKVVVDFTTPTKSSIESVRLVEKVIAMIEIDEEEIADSTMVLEKKKELVKFVCVDVPPSELQQVVVSLPTGHARRLLSVIAEILELVRNPKTGGYPRGFPVEACVSAGLFLIQAQAKYLIGEPHSRQVLLKVKELFHDAITRQLNEVGMASASIRLLK